MTFVVVFTSRSFFLCVCVCVCAVFVCHRFSWLALPLMSRRSQPARACKKVSASNSDNRLPFGGEDFFRALGYSPVSDTTVTGSMEEGTGDELPLEDAEASESRLPNGSFEPDWEKIAKTIMARLAVPDEYGASGFSSSGRESGGADKNRLVEKLAPYTAGTDMSAYIKKLEDDLADIGVHRSQYKSILTRKIQACRALSILSSIDRSTCSYTDIKMKLIDGLGSNLTSLGIKLFSEYQNTVRSMSSRDAYLHLKSLTDSVNLLTASKEELLLFMATAIYRASRTLYQRGIMDGREINSFKGAHT